MFHGNITSGFWSYKVSHHIFRSAFSASLIRSGETTTTAQFGICCFETSNILQPKIVYFVRKSRRRILLLTQKIHLQRKFTLCHHHIHNEIETAAAWFAGIGLG
jgi:hypothetical protein